MIVARIEIDFRAPVRFGEEVEVSVRGEPLRHEELRPRATSCASSGTLVAVAKSVPGRLRLRTARAGCDPSRMAREAERGPA